MVMNRYAPRLPGNITVPSIATGAPSWMGGVIEGIGRVGGDTVPADSWIRAGSGGGAKVEEDLNTSGAASIKNVLTQYGLEELIPYVDGWVRNGMSWPEIELMLRDPSTKPGKVFDARFSAIRLRREAGLAPISPEEYVNYERRAHQMMQSAGLPKGFYDGREDFTNLLVADISLEELNDRVKSGYAEVANAPQEIRDAFRNFFGASGDAALASYFLDPSKAMPVLDKAVRDAQIGGAGLQFGINLTLTRAQDIAGTGANYESARQGFDALGGLKPLFDETISEGRDLTAEGEGIDALFGLDAGRAKQDISRRLEERQAAFGGGGGAAAGQGGVFGLGSAK